MVVRERRRIASLARTASSLDEKVQEAEATASAKDAAFRAHVDEQRHEAAALAQNQQEHILSLMEMVREEPIQDSDDVDDATKSRIGENGKRAFLSEGKGNSKLLVLANERIAVLERQLHELQLGREAIVKHREREDEAKALLDEKTKECEELEEELLDLRSALRHIREEVSCPKDKSESVSPTNEDGVHFSTLQSVFDIVVKSLHPTSGWSGTKSKRQKSSASSRNIAMSPGLSIERDTQFVHTSDSDEMPDWAEDIMQDLAIIAEGKMPSSLLESPGVLDAEAQLEKTNVFERLTNPESFTGIQKQKNSRNTRTKKVRHPAEPSSDGHKQRKMISKHVADSLSKVVVPGENSKPTDTGGKLSEEKVSSVKSDSTKRSVFDRLLSPSNMTGTQRHKNQGKNGKPTRSGSLNLEKTFDSEATCSKHFQFEDEAPDEKNAEEMLDDILLRDDKDNLGVTNQSNTSKNQSASLNSTKREESDVFERLNKTTTQAYAVKQHVNIAEKMLEDILDDTEGSEVTTEGERSKSEPHFERVDEYVQQNVFERLQKTTTLAYAGKQNSNIVEKKPEKLPQSEHSSPVGKGKQDILLSPSSSRTIATPGKKKASVLSGDERNPRSTAIETGLISNSADRLLDDILDN